MPMSPSAPKYSTRIFALVGPRCRSVVLKVLTAVYQYQIRDGWTVQPNFQYIVHPGGGVTDPLGANPGRLLRNAIVFGMRTTLKF
jgi:porin